MKLDQLSEVLWQVYDGGRPSATNQTLEQEDFGQLVYMAAASSLKLRLYESRKDRDDEKTDLIAGMLSSMQFELTDANYQGRRTAAFTEEVMRLPKNTDVTNVYMVADNCGGTVNGEITQMQPAEENFYANDTDLKFFKFYVQKAGRIDTYNIPPCVKKIEVERIYLTENLDIPLDMAFEISTYILGVVVKMKGFIPTEDNSSDGNRNQLRYQLEQQEKKKLG